MDQILLKMEKAYASRSSLPGGSLQAQGDVAGNDPLQARIAHLDLMTQQTIKELSGIQHGYPIMAYETEDGFQSGFICAAALRDSHPEIVRRFSRLFYSTSHADICVVFRDELRAVGRRYQK